MEKKKERNKKKGKKGKKKKIKCKVTGKKNMMGIWDLSNPYNISLNGTEM
jgi:hypothetical protein